MGQLGGARLLTSRLERTARPTGSRKLTHCPAAELDTLLPTLFARAFKAEL